MKTNKDYRDEAIEEHIGNVQIGDVVAHQSHKLTHTLIDIVGKIGTCQLPDDTINHFFITELFNVNSVAATAFNNKIIDGMIVNRNN